MPGDDRVKDQAAAMTSVVFVLPRFDWLESNLSLIEALAKDDDMAVTVVLPGDGKTPAMPANVAVEAFPFYEPSPPGAVLQKLRGVYTNAVRRRRRIDDILERAHVDCVITVSDTSREVLPFVMLARRRGASVVFMQSVFLAPGLREHIRGENRRMLRKVGLGGAIKLLVRRAVLAAAGMPATILKPSCVGARSDYVLVVNEAQRRVIEATAGAARIVVTGAPFVDHIRAVVAELPLRSSRPEFLRQMRWTQDAPVILYVSKSLEQFAQITAEAEREIQEFVVRSLLSHFPDAHVIVKLHPIEGEAAFRGVRGDPRVRLLKQFDIHELIHHAGLVVSLGTSTPALHSVFHGRPRLILARVDDIPLDYQRPLLDVSTVATTRDEFVACLRQMRARGGWQDAGALTAPDKIGFFRDGFDGRGTERVHVALRRALRA